MKRNSWESILPISFFHFSHQFVNVKGSTGVHDQLLDRVFTAVHIQKATHNDRKTIRIHLEAEMCDIN